MSTERTLRRAWAGGSADWLKRLSNDQIEKT